MIHTAMKRWFRPILVGACVLAAAVTNLCAAGPEGDKQSFEQYLRASAVPPATIDRFLHGPSWARFDPELGYVLGNYLPADGLDRSATLSTVQENGARTAFMYAGKRCRINTYGDSFTQCHQVSDGETWQEYLAAHLGEPVRNFGMGGYGVYQAYRRLLREEKTKHAAEYLIFYIWGDDHIRSLLRCRHAAIYPLWDNQGGRMFHKNFWPNVEMDLETGRFVERENLLSTADSLRHMTETQWMVDHLKDDLAKERMACFDLNLIQLRDFKNYKLSYEDYMKQYFIGHYNPRGNHFFAYAIKDVVVQWLDPKPITYQKLDPQTIDFKGYLKQP